MCKLLHYLIFRSDINIQRIMTGSSPGLCSSIQLIHDEKNKGDLGRCIICQNIKDTKGDSKLTSNPEGRKNIIDASHVLQDDILLNFTESDFDQVQYHVNTSYARYKKMQERIEHRRNAAQDSGFETTTRIDSINTVNPEIRPKRRKTMDKLIPDDKPCIICNQIKCQSVLKRFRISESNHARNLINAVNFNKDSVYTRCILYKTPGDIFAADVMYHKKCMVIYIGQFMRDIDNLMSSADVNDDPCLEDAFEKMLLILELDKCGYALSDCRELMNKELHTTGVGKL